MQSEHEVQKSQKPELTPGTRVLITVTVIVLSKCIGIMVGLYPASRSVNIQIHYFHSALELIVLAVGVMLYVPFREKLAFWPYIILDLVFIVFVLLVLAYNFVSMLLGHTFVWN